MGKFADYAAELDEEKPATGKPTGKFARYAAELDRAEAETPQRDPSITLKEPTPSVAKKPESLAPTLKGPGEGMADFDINRAIASTVNGPLKPRELPGDTPRLTAPGSEEHRQAAIDASVASAAHAETPEQKATREFRGLLGGSQQAVPFFPRIRGAVAGFAAEEAAALRALAGQEPENTEFARMQAAYLERKHAQRQIDKAASSAPATAAIGNVLTTAALPLGAPKTVGGRIAASTGYGAASGASAVDRPGVTGEELLAGGTVGGIAGGTAGALGEGMRLGIGTAPAREDKAFTRELTRANAGEGQMAMLAKNKEGILKDYKNIVAMRRDPEIRKAVGMKEGKGIPVIDERLSPLREAQDARYAQIDASLEHPFNQGTMTANRLLDELEAAKRTVSPRAAEKISNVQNDIRKHWIPYVWDGGDKVIPSREVRRWLSNVQSTAADTPGALNWTNTYASTEEASRAAKKIFNDYLDSAALPKVAEEIRRDNTKITTLLHIRGAMEAKAKKETLAQIGLGQINEQANRSLEHGAAGAAALSGHPEAAVALLMRQPVEKAMAGAARFVNRRLLDPLQLAADAGNKQAKAVISLVSSGVPISTALQLVSRLEKRAGEWAREPKKDGEAAQRLSLAPMFTGGQP